jgi:hypothetical protein
MASNPSPTKTTFATATTARTEDKPIPEGYVFLYPGIINIYLREKTTYFLN